MNNALIFIIDTIFDIVCFLFLARLILQICRADFYNPISQGIVKATDPVLKPLRALIPGYRNLDVASLLVAWLAEREVPVRVALTKCDKLKPMRRAQRVRVLKQETGLAKSDVIATSAQSGDGMQELWAAIDGLV